MVIKVVIGSKNGKSLQQELNEDQSAALYGKKIGEKFSGNEIGFDGYEFEITGGSDSSGTPMRRDVDQTGKKRILAIEGTGLKKKGHGQKQRKTVCGNTVYEKISQVNIKVTKEGSKPLGPEEPAAEEGNAQAPAEEKKE
ncbi:30S ribosomal protein S6e [Candidatus Woesearchaeota archaeon]|nr:30S ribosomal protein S6e [Candidatus Woesearchaeota archaeon]